MDFMTPLLWLGLALALAAVELVTGAFVIVFFAFGAICAAAIRFVMPDASPFFVWGAFGVLSVASMTLLRRRFVDAFRQKSESFEARDEGRVVTLPSELAPGQELRVEYQGTEFSALNVGRHVLPAGRARIVGVEGVKLHVDMVDNPKLP